MTPRTFPITSETAARAMGDGFGDLRTWMLDYDFLHHDGVRRNCWR